MRGIKQNLYHEIYHGGMGIIMEQENHTSVEQDDDKKSSGKYVFECQKSGQCCQDRDSVVVGLSDLERWNKDLTLPSLYPYLVIELVNDSFIQISLKKNPGDAGEVQKGCPLYDEENKICNIYFSMPHFCNSFPLGYDGHNYYIKDRSCPGLGKGNMTEESLKKARETAREDFEAQVTTSMLLPVIHGLTMGFILDQSKKRLDELSPEQKKKLDELLGKGEEKEQTD
jgi:Fe-S-cluster containining protein